MDENCWPRRRVGVLGRAGLRIRLPEQPANAPWTRSPAIQAEANRFTRSYKSEIRLQDPSRSACACAVYICCTEAPVFASARHHSMVHLSKDHKLEGSTDRTFQAREVTPAARVTPSHTSWSPGMRPLPSRTVSTVSTPRVCEPKTHVDGWKLVISDAEGVDLIMSSLSKTRPGKLPQPGTAQHPFQRFRSKRWPAMFVRLTSFCWVLQATL